MKYRFAEIMIALFAVASGLGFLRLRIDQFPYFGMLVFVLYLTAAFAVLRRLSFVRYLYYLNLAFVLCVVALVLYLSGLRFVLQLAIPLTLSVFAAVYCQQRKDVFGKVTKPLRELAYFSAVLVLSFALLYLFFSPPPGTFRNLEGPIGVRANTSLSFTSAVTPLPFGVANRHALEPGS